jgi:uncharacterized membrane protein YraQ (UPF0718 family)
LKSYNKALRSIFLAYIIIIMEMILFLIAGLVVGLLIGWLLGKSNSRTEWEKKNALIQQQYVDLEKEFVGYRATQTSQLGNVQQQLRTKVDELIALQHSIKENRDQLVESGALLSGATADLRAANQMLHDKNKEGEIVKVELQSIKQQLATALQQVATQTANNER